MVDWARVPYRTRCRFLRDNPLECEIRWVTALPDAPTLGSESVICNSYNEIDKEMGWPVGEVWGARRPYIPDRIPPGLVGGHVCGTAEEFAQGGEYRPDLPPVEYAANGWPLCCDPPKRARGGGGAGGMAYAAVVPAVSVRGGAGAGGMAYAAVVPASSPGQVCTDALDMEYGVPQTFNVTYIASNWVRVPIPSSTLLRIIATVPGSLNRMQVATGPNCGDLIDHFDLFAPGGCGVFFESRPDCYVYLDAFALSISGDVTFTVEPGVCP